MHNQKGNVLFLILIAVALFAALSYAITTSTRSSGGNASEEKTSLIAAQITQYGSTIENAVLRLRLSHGCSETEISFESDNTEYNFSHTPAVADKCKLFLPSGGGVSFQEPKAWFDAASFNAGYMLWFTGDVGVKDIGTNAPELTMSLWGVRKDICDNINKSLGIISSGSTPTENADLFTGGLTDFTGSYNPVSDAIGDDSGSVFKGKPSGCVTPDGTNFVYYHTLIPR